MSHQHFMSQAIEQGKLAKQAGEWPFGCVIVCEGKVIVQERCSETADKNVLSHAELKAVGEACRVLGRNNLSDCTIYCTNEPCVMCAAAIFQAKIPTVVIAASRTDFPHLMRPRTLGVEDVAKDSGYEIEIIRDVLKDEVLELFSDIRK